MPVTVNEARATLGRGGLRRAPDEVGPEPPIRRSRLTHLLRRAGGRSAPALRLRDVWYEIEDGPVALRGVTLDLAAGERVALMGRIGAGKSTLLRLAKSLVAPTRGRIERTGEVALLLQNPGDYLIHQHAVEDAGEAGVAAAGLAGREQANPRDLSGGERQRLALEVVLAGGACAAVLLDEPTMGLAHAGAGVMVATHDSEFAATFADRVVLLGPGTVIADGPPADVLGGGRHFSTQVARITDGRALLPGTAAAGLVAPEPVGELAR